MPEPATLLAVLEKHRPTRLAPQQESSVERWATEVKAMHELGAKPVAIFDRLRLEHKDFTGSPPGRLLLPNPVSTATQDHGDSAT